MSQERRFPIVKIVRDRQFPDDLDLGDLTLLDFIHVESHLQEIWSILNKLPVATYGDELPRNWHEIFVNGKDDILEFQLIAKLQEKIGD